MGWEILYERNYSACPELSACPFPRWEAGAARPSLQVTPYYNVTAHIPRCREEEESEEDARERARLRNAEAAAEAAARKERRRKAAEKKAEQKGRAHAQRAAAARAGGPGAGKEDEAAAAGGAVVSVGLLLQVGVKFACRDLLGV